MDHESSATQTRAAFRRRAIRDGMLVAGVIYLAYLVSQTVLNGPGYDARAYFDANLSHLYARAAAATYDAYYYSPAFAQLIAPLTALPWQAFLLVWMVGAGLALTYLSGPLLIIVLALPPVTIELAVGNIHFLLGLAVFLGFRWPATWAFVLLTKVTPGIGLLWFLVRREWRSLAIALGATAAVVAVSFVLAPSLWSEWISALRTNAGTSYDWPLLPIPLRIRLVGAALLIIWGARTDRRWTVPLGATLALPLLWPANWAMAVGVLPDARRGLARRWPWLEQRAPAQPSEAAVFGDPSPS